MKGAEGRRREANGRRVDGGTSVTLPPSDYRSDTFELFASLFFPLDAPLQRGCFSNDRSF